MFKLIRQSHQHLRLWLIAATAVLLLTSILEAGHVHGTFTPADDHCTLCQHSVSLGEAFTTKAVVFIPVLQAIQASGPQIHFTPGISRTFALIRAPPFALQRQ